MDNSNDVLMNTQAEDDDEIEINLGDLFRALYNKIWMIGASVLIVGIIFYLIAAFLITPKYESSVKMYVNNKTDSSSTVSSSDISASQSLVDTYAVILKSYPTMNEVIEATGVNYTYEELTEIVSVKAINSTEVFAVTVTSADPEEAMVIANTIADIAPDELMEQVEGSSVKVVEYAREATSPSSPNVLKYTLIGLLIGLFISCAVVILQEVIAANTLSVEDKLKNNFDLPILSVIPDLSGQGGNTTNRKKRTPVKDSDLICDKLSFGAAEAYKLLRTNLSFCIVGEDRCKVIGVTSSVQGEGKSTLAINLAYTLSQTGQRVCLIDCDMRLPTIAKKMKLKGHPGLSNIVSGQVNGSEGILQKKVTNKGSFYVIAAGDIPPNPAELLDSAGMENLLNTIRNAFDYIILDMPPVMVVSDALIAAKLTNGMIVAVREDVFDRKTLTDATTQLRNVNANVLGFVVTDSLEQQKEYKKKGYGYGYGYGYGHAATEKAAD